MSEMRAVFRILALVACLLTGCSNTSSQTSSADHSVGDRKERVSTFTSQGGRIDNDMPRSEDDEEPIVAAPKGVSAADMQRADEIVQAICGIVTREVTTHEFPSLWAEGSRESQLAREYKKIVGGPIDDTLERNCLPYAKLHSKNH